MKFEIKRAKNGYFVTVTDLDVTDPSAQEVFVFQEKYDEGEEVEAFAELLREMLDSYGPSTSRYSPKRIYICIEPGDKYEDLNKIDFDSDFEKEPENKSGAV